jgi:cytochrome P450
MLHHGDVQSRIQSEVDLVIGPDRAPSLIDRALMPYTEAAILETLRFGSISPTAPHSVTEDVIFRGHAIPKESVVSCTYVLVY